MAIVVDAIETGSKAITSASGTTIDTTITSVDTSRSIVLYTIRTADSEIRLKRHIFQASLTSSTNMRLVRYEAANAKDLTVEYTIIEFAAASLDSLQVGTVAVTSDPTDTTITGVTLAQTFVVHSYKTSGNTVGNHLPGATYLTSTTNLRIDPPSAPAAGLHDAYYQVVELSSDLIVQSGTNTFASGDFSDTVTITSVDTGATAAFPSGADYKISPDARCLLRATLASATSVTLDRFNPGSDAAVLAAYQVLEFTGLAVQSGTTTIADTATSANPTFTELGADSVVMNLTAYLNSVMSSETGTFPDDLAHSIVLSATPDDVVLTRIGSNQAISIAWNIIDFTAAAGAQPIARPLTHSFAVDRAANY